MNIEIVIYILLGGFIAGIMNTMAGGGSLLTLPILIFAGIPSTIANGTNRIAIWVQCITAMSGFHRHGISKYRLGFFLSIPAIIGAILGAQFAVDISESLFEKILAFIMIMVVGVLLWNPKPAKSIIENYTWSRKLIAAIVFFGIGFYGGFIQVGVGFMLTAALVLVCGLDLVVTAGVKVMIVAIYTTMAILVFIQNGHVDWWAALILSIGNGLGGYVGSHMTVMKGEKWIRIVLFVTVIAMALKLLGFWPF